MMAVFPRKFCVSKAHFSGQESVKICPEMRHWLGMGGQNIGWLSYTGMDIVLNIKTTLVSDSTCT